VRDFRSALGERVRELRLHRKLSQQALAERADLHWTYVSGIERGRRNPGLNTLGSIAVALRVSLAELVKDRGRYVGLTLIPWSVSAAARRPPLTRALHAEEDHGSRCTHGENGRAWERV
jgi:transcriptional regulator with XRE-family HTH domain